MYIITTIDFVSVDLALWLIIEYFSSSICVVFVYVNIHGSTFDYNKLYLFFHRLC